MIVGQLTRIQDYEALIPGLLRGLEAIKNADGLPVGRYPFDGGFYLIQEGQTKPFDEQGFEAHKHFIDVQIVVTGSEEIAWLDLDDLETVIPYDESTDKVKLSGPTTHRMIIGEGMFWVAFPSDGHQAIAHTNIRHSYRKIVLKLTIHQGG